MIKKFIILGLKNQNIVWTLLYGLSIGLITKSIFSLLSIVVLFLSLRHFLNRRHLIYKRRILFLIFNGVLLALTTDLTFPWILISFLLLLSVSFYYHYFAGDFWDLLSWILSFDVIEDGLITREHVSINNNKFDPVDVFPLTKHEIKSLAQLLSFIDRKLIITKTVLFDEPYEIFQIHYEYLGSK